MSGRQRWIVSLLAFFLLRSAFCFEGRIHAALTRGGDTQTLLYTVASNQLRIERTETNRPYARNIVRLDTGAITLLFPHNRSFVRLKNAESGGAPSFPGAPTMPPPPGGLPLGTVSQTSPGSAATAAGAPPLMPSRSAGPPGVGPHAGGFRGGPGIPALPMEPVELKSTGETTNLLGYNCARYELKRRAETMEIWATDRLLPFEPWLPNPSRRFGPRLIEEQWPELLRSKNLFPLLAILTFENGPERLRFEVKAVTPEKIEDRDASLFQPPPDYREIGPLPF
jgi:hypothetical protein